MNRTRRTRGSINLRVSALGRVRYCVQWADAQRHSYCRAFYSQAEAEAFRDTLPYFEDRTLHAKVTNRMRIDASSGCWVVSGSTKSNGYPRVSAEGKRYSTHRAMFEAFYGPIPVGMTLDHICRNLRCANPEHLEPVTIAENTRRGESPSIVASRRNSCIKKGHPFTPENTLTYANGKRTCRACRDQRAASRERS